MTPRRVTSRKHPSRPAIGLLIFGAMLILGCGGSDVSWDDYDLGLRARIDSFANSGDCAGLILEYEIADANSADVLRRTGHDNTDLILYIQDKMVDAYCHD